MIYRFSELYGYSRLGISGTTDNLSYEYNSLQIPWATYILSSPDERYDNSCGTAEANFSLIFRYQEY